MLRQSLNILFPQKEEVSVTPHKLSEEKLQLSESLYRRVFETVRDGMLILDAVSGEIIDVNLFLMKLLGYSKTELLKKKLWDIGVFEGIADSKAAFRQLQTKEYIYYSDLPLQTKSGRVVEVEFVGYVCMVDHQKVVYCNIRDITGRRKVEEKVSMQATALKAAANSIVITDIQGIIKWVNPAFIKLTGYTFKEAVGQSMRILNSGKQDKLFYQNLWKTILSGEVWKGEIIDRKKDGSFYIEEQTITPVKGEKGGITSFIAIKQDVTARKKLEEELTLRNVELERENKAQEEMRKALINVMEDLEVAGTATKLEKVKDEAMLASIGEGVIAVDKGGKVIVMNKAAEDMLGWKAKDLMGREITDLPLEDEAGHRVPFDKRPTTRSLSTGEKVRATYFFVRKDKIRFPIAITVAPIVRGGEIVGLIEITRDITRDLEIDRAKSEFVSLASHQLRTPLGIIKWYLEALETEDYFNKAPVVIRKYVDEIYKSNERVLSLVRNLLSVSRIEQGRVKNVPKLVDPVRLVKEVVEQMQIVAGKRKVALHLTIQDQKIPSINVDVLRLHEVIENLIGNAIEYTLAAGAVDVAVSKAGDTLFMSVKDTGIGMSMADQKRLFTKFFRSEKAIEHNPEGSGLGLYLVKSYVEGWGGKLSVESVEGKGSTFTVSLPISQKEDILEGEHD